MVQVDVDFGAERGRIRPLHGANNGPRCLGGIMDLSDGFRELSFPILRLHDCEWPADMVVDVHTIFTDFDADPEDPASYDFKLTDEYLTAIVDLGMGIEYRLGCRIEHTKHRRNAHPPRDFAKWARICVGIIRHYNEGWADGHRWGIRHWEIWNEPDIPPGCWSGTWEDYYRLYVTAAREIKLSCPDVLVGGPAYAYATDDHSFIDGFLTACREADAPLDFFSWHTYAGRDLSIWEKRSRTMREMLDAQGYASVPSHLNEWNCCPEGDWQHMGEFARGLNGPKGAAGVAMSLTLFQDLPIDEAFLYTADTLVYGLFTRDGERQKNWFGVRAFRHMLDTPMRAAATGTDASQGVAALAGVAEDRKSAQVLVSRYVTEGDAQLHVNMARVPWDGPTHVEVMLLDDSHSLDVVETRQAAPGNVTLEDPLPPATVRLYRLSPV